MFCFSVYFLALASKYNTSLKETCVDLAPPLRQCFTKETTGNEKKNPWMFLSPINVEYRSDFSQKSDCMELWVGDCLHSVAAAGETAVANDYSLSNIT